MDQQTPQGNIPLVLHELRSPLTGASGYLELALHVLLPPLLESTESSTHASIQQIERCLGLAESEIEVLTALLNDLSVSEGAFVIHPQTLDLVTLVRSHVQAKQQFVTSIRLDISVGEAVVRADPLRIRQVLTNYLNNAIKYSPADQPVKVVVEGVGMDVRVSVVDQGPGIPFIEQGRIWERGYRAEEQASQPTGLGLGLYICRTLIEQHQPAGRVGVQSSPGLGSTFWFTLPVA